MAWEKLSNRDSSLSATIVKALTPEMESTPCSLCPINAEMLRNIMHQEISEVLATFPANVQPVSAPEESDGRKEISDSDFDAAIDFMGGL